MELLLIICVVLWLFGLLGYATAGILYTIGVIGPPLIIAFLLVIVAGH